MSSIGKQIRKLRLSKGLALDELAKLSGVPTSYIWEVENKDKINAIVGALGVSLASLLEDVMKENIEETKRAENDKKIIDDIMKSLD